MFPRPSYQSWPHVAFVQHTRQWRQLHGFSVAADARREAPRSGLGLAGRDRGDAQPEFIPSRPVPMEQPLVESRALVVAQGGLRRACKFVREPQRFGQRVAGLDEAIGESDR